MSELPNAPRRDDVPRYDAERYELWYRGRLLKRYDRPAANQTAILAAFEEEGWPDSIDDPISGDGGDPVERLHDTVKNLNKNMVGKPLRFHTCRNGQGIRWEALPGDAG